MVIILLFTSHVFFSPPSGFKLASIKEDELLANWATAGSIGNVIKKYYLNNSNTIVNHKINKGTQEK